MCGRAGRPVVLYGIVETWRQCALAAPPNAMRSCALHASCRDRARVYQIITSLRPPHLSVFHSLTDERGSVQPIAFSPFRVTKAVVLRFRFAVDKALRTAANARSALPAGKGSGSSQVWLGVCNTSTVWNPIPPSDPTPETTSLSRRAETTVARSTSTTLRA